jgi:hypothetical protein
MMATMISGSTPNRSDAAAPALVLTPEIDAAADALLGDEDGPVLYQAWVGRRLMASTMDCLSGRRASAA